MIPDNEKKIARAGDYVENAEDTLNGGVTESDVLRYVINHPEFLVNNIEAIRRITPREHWSGESVIDLQSIMIDRSQEAVDDLRLAARNVIETSRSNMSIQARTHAAILALLEVENFGDLVCSVTQDWPHLLDVDVVSLGFEFSRAPFPALINDDINQLPLGTIRQFLGPDLNVRLFDEMVDDGTVFGEGAGLANTAALARIESGFELPPGLLALGAREDTFVPGQGTELVSFLSAVLAITVRRCLIHKT